VTTRHFIIATAGHVDHGKSALVKALTGTDPDRLPEEKARQITIELGFAELNLTTPTGETIHAGIVDVPGHEDFVRNMIAGVGSIDLALFVVAADDGWMPQTEEHFQILTYLGVKRAVIALNEVNSPTPKLFRRPSAPAKESEIWKARSRTSSHNCGRRAISENSGFLPIARLRFAASEQSSPAR